MSEITSRRGVLKAGVALVVTGAAGAAGAGQASARPTATPDPTATPAPTDPLNPTATPDPTPSPGRRRVVALTGATVVDASGHRREWTVLVDGDRIVAAGRRVPVPDGAEVLDLRGKFLIPGLFDAHVHTIPVETVSPPLYLANGITTVREMSGTPLLHEWRARVERGDLFGPRSAIASRIVDGAHSIGGPDWFVIVENEAQAREAVRQAVREGADLVKVYSSLPEDLYHVIADEARRRRIPFAGHLPDRVPLGEASTTGQRSLEHLNGVWYATSTREREIRARIEQGELDQDDIVAWMRATHRLEWDAATGYSQGKAAPLLARLAREQTTVVPTLSVYQVMDRPEEITLDDERLKYVPASIVEGWHWALDNIIKAGRTPEETAQRHAMLDKRMAFVRALDRAGVPLVAGTDGGDLPFVLPAYGLHEELALLVRAELTPLRALLAATVEAARLLGLDHLLGTIEPGKLADLVVLDADPLADIRNTTRIHSVLTRGRVISPAQRARMLADVAAACAAHQDSGGVVDR